MIQAICAITGALIIAAVCMSVLVACAMWLFAIWNGNRDDRAAEALNAQIHDLDRWLAECPQAVMVLDFLREWNVSRRGNVAELRERIGAVTPGTRSKRTTGL
jgi:hypothetical protein